MLTTLKNLLLDPYPLRSLTLRFAKWANLGSFDFKFYNGLHERPNYAHILTEGALLAKRLGLKRVSAVEFGVASGNGLLAMERLADQVEARHGVAFEIYGFDTGRGLPPPVDYRDLPYHWQEGFFAMDVPVLQAKLKRAKLVLGDVRETSKTFFQTHDPAPIAAVAHDFDYYSSTVAALQMFNAPSSYFLPRVFCYFDDVIGGPIELYNNYTGQLGAIADYNAVCPEKKICRPEYMKAIQPQIQWYQQIFVHHDFGHPDYCRFVSEPNQQLFLEGA
jgi:hypothetical protein